MKKNNWLSYSAYMVVLLGYIIFSNKVLIFLNNQSQMTYVVLPLMLWSMVIFIVLGVLLGLEKLVLEAKKNGSWRINLPKIILLGVPALYFSLGVFIYYCPINFIRQTLSYPIQFFLEGNINFISIFQIILGYIIITSFIKVKD